MSALQSLPDPPSDGISSISYIRQTSLLASTSWDGSIRVHDTSQMAPVLASSLESGPLLSLCGGPDENTLVCGTLDGTLRVFDLSKSSTRKLGNVPDSIGKSSSGCSCLRAVGDDDPNLIVAAGWSKTMTLWDIRAGEPVTTIELPGKAFDMDVHVATKTLAVATSGRRTCIADLRGGKLSMVLDRESSLKFQSRCIRFFQDGNSIAVGSVEGRVAVEPLEEIGRQALIKKYAFKCHRVGDTVYPVNSIAFHPTLPNLFATGGCDGTIAFWDGFKKKKLFGLPAFPTSVACMAFKSDGSELAIASSYTFEDGDRAHPKDEIFVRHITDADFSPRS